MESVIASEAEQSATFWRGGLLSRGERGISLLAMTHDAASHIGVFGEGPGEGVFAKTPSPKNSCLSDLRLLCGEQSFSCAAELDKGGLAG